MSRPPLRPSLRGQVAPFIVMDVMSAAAAREAAGGDVLHLEVGQPSTPAPRGVLEAARRALDSDRIGYTLALGIPTGPITADGTGGFDTSYEDFTVTTGPSTPTISVSPATIASSRAC